LTQAGGGRSLFHSVHTLPSGCRTADSSAPWLLAGSQCFPKCCSIFHLAVSFRPFVRPAKLSGVIFEDKSLSPLFGWPLPSFIAAIDPSRRFVKRSSVKTSSAPPLFFPDSASFPPPFIFVFFRLFIFQESGPRPRQKPMARFPVAFRGSLFFFPFSSNMQWSSPFSSFANVLEFESVFASVSSSERREKVFFFPNGSGGIPFFPPPLSILFFFERDR